MTDDTKRRTHVRRRTEFAVVLAREPKGPRLIGYDISEGGFALRAPPGLKEGDLLEVLLHLPGVAKPIGVAARVRSVRTAGTRLVAGLAFARIADEDRRLVSLFAQQGAGFMF